MKKTNSTNNKFNSVPPSIFTPFKKGKLYTNLFMVLSLLLSAWMLINVLLGKMSFTPEQLKDMSGFTLTSVFVVATLGFTIFSVIKPEEEHPKKNQILFSYIGTSFLIASISIFSYILSYFEFLNVYIYNTVNFFSIYFCAMILLICRCITSILSTIVAYFNIKE